MGENLVSTTFVALKKCRRADNRRNVKGLFLLILEQN